LQYDLSVLKEKCLSRNSSHTCSSYGLGGADLANVPRVDRAPALMVKLLSSSYNSFINVYYFHHNPPWYYFKGSLSRKKNPLNGYSGKEQQQNQRQEGLRLGFCPRLEKVGFSSLRESPKEL
jgi:hypothetical protein